MIKINPSWFVFFLFLLLGIVFVITRPNYFTIWIGFELSVIGFLPIFFRNSTTIEGIIKYFLIQAGGSSLFLLSFLLRNPNLSSITFLTRLLLKLGIFPFYQWVPIIIRSLEWTGCLFLATFQKIAPLFVIVQLKQISTIALSIAAIRVAVRGILGFNQSKFRALMGYSSISHRGWILTAATARLKLLIIYFLIYLLLTISLFKLFQEKHTLTIVHRRTQKYSNNKTNLLLLTLSGIPPFTIFFLKVILLSFLIYSPLITIIFILGTVLSIYFYLTFIIPNLLSSWVKEKLPIKTTILTTLLPATLLPALLII